MAQTTKNPTVFSTDSGHKGSTTGTTKHSDTTTDGKITTMIDNSLKHLSVTTTSSCPSTTLSGHAELQADQDRSDNDLQILSQHSLLQVAISSLVVLAAVCIAVCAIMVTLFIMACKKKQSTNQQPRSLQEALSRWRSSYTRLKMHRSTLLWKSSSNILNCIIIIIATCVLVVKPKNYISS